VTKLALHYDLRHPAQFPASAVDIYGAALDQIAWGETRGFTQVSFGEHHQATDGYNPCPLLFAAAIGGRTSTIRVRINAVIAPLYHPIRLAEEIAVADLLLQGRLEVSVAAGYMPDDFEMFGQPYRGRGRRLEEIVAILRLAWTGEPFEFEGKTVRVTPRPYQDPMPIHMGGNADVAIERAARVADGFHAARFEDYERYRAACATVGRTVPPPLPPQGPIFLWITDDVDRAWDWLEPHVRHQVDTYAAWSAAAFGKPDAGAFVPKDGVDIRRSNDAYRVMTPTEAINLAHDLGEDGVLHFSPLLAGIDPARSWEMLERFETAVLPHI